MAVRDVETAAFVKRVLAGAPVVVHSNVCSVPAALTNNAVQVREVHVPADRSAVKVPWWQLTA